MHSDGTGVLMICRLSLRAAQKWAPSSYTGRRSLLSPQPTRMGLGPRDKDSGNFVLGSEVLGECSTALCLHFTLRKETPPLRGAPRWTPAHILMSSWSLIWHVQAAALELGREGLSLGILLWMALVRKAGREMEMKIKMDIAWTSTERLTKAEVCLFVCLFFDQMLLERNMQLRKKISPLVIWFSFWTSFCFLFKLRTGVKYCRSHEFLPLMEATSGAFSLGSPLGPSTKGHWFRFSYVTCAGILSPDQPCHQLEQKQLSIIYELHLALGHYWTASGEAVCLRSAIWCILYHPLRVTTMTKHNKKHVSRRTETKHSGFL